MEPSLWPRLLSFKDNTFLLFYIFYISSLETALVDPANTYRFSFCQADNAPKAADVRTQCCCNYFICSLLIIKPVKFLLGTIVQV